MEKKEWWNTNTIKRTLMFIWFIGGIANILMIGFWVIQNMDAIPDYGYGFIIAFMLGSIIISSFVTLQFFDKIIKKF